MADYWPMLDIDQAIRDCDRNLEDIIRYAEALSEDGNPALLDLIQRTTTLRKSLTTLRTPALCDLIRQEQEAYDIAEGEWAAHQANNYLGG